MESGCLLSPDLGSAATRADMAAKCRAQLEPRFTALSLPKGGRTRKRTTPTDKRASVTAWDAKVRTAAAKRDAAIHSTREDGASLREIGEAAGLSHTAVAKILLAA